MATRQVVLARELDQRRARLAAGRWWRRRRSAAGALSRLPRCVQEVERVRGRATGRSRRRRPAPRQKSDEITSVGMKCRGGERGLAGAATRRSARPGIGREARSSSRGTPPSGSARPPRGPRRRRQRTHRVAIALARRPPPRPRTPRASTRSGGRDGETRPPAASRAEHVVLGVGRGHDHARRARLAEHVALQRRQPRRVEVLDHLDQRGRVEARQRRSR